MDYLKVKETPPLDAVQAAEIQALRARVQELEQRVAEVERDLDHQSALRFENHAMRAETSS